MLNNYFEDFGKLDSLFGILLGWVLDIAFTYHIIHQLFSVMYGVVQFDTDELMKLALYATIPAWSAIYLHIRYLNRVPVGKELLQHLLGQGAIYVVAKVGCIYIVDTLIPF